MQKQLSMALILAFTTLILAGCAESERDKYYRQQNEDRKKVEQISHDAAESIQKMDTSRKAIKD